MNNETTDAATIFAPLWRRKWTILIVGLLVAGATYIYYRGQTTVYQAKTQLYFGSAAEQQGIVNNTLGKASLSAAQISNQAAFINSAIREAVHQQLRGRHDRAEARGKVHAKTTTGSDFIEISAEAHTPRAAATLANLYAHTYVTRHQEGYRRAVKAAIATTRRQLRRIEANAQAAQAAASHAKTKGSSAGRSAGLAGVATLQAATLSAKVSQLESDLSISSVQQVEPATKASAQLLGPSPKKNAVFGFVIGLALAALAAYAVERFDRRLRSLDELEAAFGAQVLAALPRVSAPIVHGQGAPAPAAPLLEPLRGLHTTIQLGDMLDPNRHDPPRSILFLSADEGEGKSTAIADLALVQRDAGARVAVIDADLRRPVQGQLLAADSARGLADVLAGAVTFEGALQSVGGLGTVAAGLEHPLADGEGLPVGGVSTVTRARAVGSLSLLAGGRPAANPPALLAGPAMRELIQTAAADFDQVLLDSPALHVADAMPLLRAVDGIVIVARPGHTRAASAERLTQLLSRSSTAPVLGIVANGVSRADMRRRGFSTGQGESRRLLAS
jgi:polysaccharide biosynthesis transport protein